MDSAATDILWLDATAQADLIATGQVSATELIDAAIARCQEVNPTLNAVIHESFDRAHRAAASIDEQAPFAGAPMVTKDLVCSEAGLPFHEGSRFLQSIDWTGPHDQELAVRFREAGLVSIGRTNTPEFGMRPVCEPAAYGPTNNPWDLTRTPGGSSGGSAAAVAAGIVAVGHGNDVGGSIRNPASNCGLFGLKPARSRSCLAPNEGRDLLLTPVLPDPPVRTGEADDLRLITFAAPFNVSGLPAASVPGRRTEDGLPVGVQFVAGPWREDVILAAAAQVERARPWQQRPDL